MSKQPPSLVILKQSQEEPARHVSSPFATFRNDNLEEEKAHATESNEILQNFAPRGQNEHYRDFILVPDLEKDSCLLKNQDDDESSVDLIPYFSSRHCMAQFLGAILLHSSKLAGLQLYLATMLGQLSEREENSDTLSYSVIRLLIYIRHLSFMQKGSFPRRSTVGSLDSTAHKAFSSLSTLASFDRCREWNYILKQAQKSIDQFFVERSKVDIRQPTYFIQPKIGLLVSAVVEQGHKKKAAKAKRSCPPSRQESIQSKTSVKRSSLLGVQEISFSEILRENKRMAILVGSALRSLPPSRPNSEE